MIDFLATLLADLPPGAVAMYLGLAIFTVLLLRCTARPSVFAVIALPGTAMHEASHLVVGKLLGAQPVSMSLWPKDLGGGRWQLGAVGFTNLTWWNAPWTAMAPMLLAPLSLCLALIWAYPAFESGASVHGAFALYVCASILQASWPSSTDFKEALPGLVILGLLGAWALQ